MFAPSPNKRHLETYKSLKKWRNHANSLSAYKDSLAKVADLALLATSIPQASSYEEEVEDDMRLKRTTRSRGTVYQVSKRVKSTCTGWLATPVSGQRKNCSYCKKRKSSYICMSCNNYYCGKLAKKPTPDSVTRGCDQNFTLDYLEKTKKGEPNQVTVQNSCWWESHKQSLLQSMQPQ